MHRRTITVTLICALLATGFVPTTNTTTSPAAASTTTPQSTPLRLVASKQILASNNRYEVVMGEANSVSFRKSLFVYDSIEPHCPSGNGGEQLAGAQPCQNELINASTIGNDLTSVPLSAEITAATAPLQGNATQCTVTTAANSGAGSLRQCLLAAKTGDSITFNPTVFPPIAPVTITLTSPLPMIVTDTLTIDGSNAGVILDGKGIGQSSGLIISGTNGVVIRGLQVLNFPLHGIALVNGAQNSTIGGDPTVGSAPLGQGNLVSGNQRIGIVVLHTNTTNNQVLGNHIGVDVTGKRIYGNAIAGVAIVDAHHNTIGGENLRARNLIGGNGQIGIFLGGAGTTNNQIQGNYIGVDITGKVALGNGLQGISLEASASHNVIGGTTAAARNLISGNGDTGIYLDEAGTTGNRILGNYIGVDVTGGRALGNGEDGIVISAGVTNTIVGGETPGARNLISGNGGTGVQIQGTGAAANQVLGNYIGVDVTGRSAISNTQGGIALIFAANHNIIGGTSPGARNLISGNGESGIHLQNSDTTDNTILGNFIGLDVTGKAPLGNQTSGILILAGASNNTIGGEVAAARNIISANTYDGVALEDNSTTGNRIVGNYIGTDVDGVRKIGNRENGVTIGEGQANIVGGESAGARNLLSGNGHSGVKITGVNARDNKIMGNWIGVNASGSSALGNLEAGVVVFGGANHNQIGGESAGAHNLISGNATNGVVFQDSNTTHNQVLGNFIGTNPTGTGALGNLGNGILISSGANNNMIGGETPGARNLISGNGQDGVYLQGAGTSNNQVKGNYIGTNLNGVGAVGNANDGIALIAGANNNIIGGTSPVARNLLSGNGDDGIYLQDISTVNNQIIGNFIGVNVNGTGRLPNQEDGIVLDFGARNNIIGGENPNARNIISGNGQGGLWLQSQTSPTGNRADVTNNRILGNYIGVDVSGGQALGNGTAGITLSAGANGNHIGGEIPGAGNVISSNGHSGVWLQTPVTQNQIQGNLIGLDVTGKVRLGNLLDGITLFEGANNNLIGGTTSAARNIISGNREAGILLQNSTTTSNKVIGNYIGTDSSGMQAIGNENGILITAGARQNNIGEPTAGAGNLISGNTSMGVQIVRDGTSQNVVAGNLIGADATGTGALGNEFAGVGLGLGPSQNTIGISNTIIYNGEYGVFIENAFKNTITRNIIHSNGLGQIKWQTTPPSTGPIPLPLPNGYWQAGRTVYGQACPRCRVEVFANLDAIPAGRVYLGLADADANGAFTVTLPISPSLPYLSSTATDPEGTTSEFSPGVMPTTLPTVVPPTLTPTPPPIIPRVWLPIIYTPVSGSFQCNPTCTINPPIIHP